jgi:hypothetical protein
LQVNRKRISGQSELKIIIEVYRKAMFFRPPPLKGRPLANHSAENLIGGQLGFEAGFLLVILRRA